MHQKRFHRSVEHLDKKRHNPGYKADVPVADRDKNHVYYIRIHCNLYQAIERWLEQVRLK